MKFFKFIRFFAIIGLLVETVGIILLALSSTIMSEQLSFVNFEVWNVVKDKIGAPWDMIVLIALAVVFALYTLCFIGKSGKRKKGKDKGFFFFVFIGNAAVLAALAYAYKNYPENGLLMYMIIAAVVSLLQFIFCFAPKHMFRKGTRVQDRKEIITSRQGVRYHRYDR